MKRGLLALALIAALVLVLLLGGVFFVVYEPQQVIITQFGRPVGSPINTPGLKMKAPFIQQAHYFDKRFLEWDGDQNEVPTKDKRFIWVDSYARWRITDPLLFFQRLRDERGAQSRLDDILDGATRITIARHNLIEAVRTSNRPFVWVDEFEQEAAEAVGAIERGRSVLAQEVLEAAQARTEDLGIEILDFRFKRLSYTEQVRQEVYSRMISERKRIAEQFRSEGAGEAARILGSKDRELAAITSEAYRQAQEIRGRSDAAAARIYAGAYNRDPEFYRFLKTMETYRETFDAETVFLLSTDGEFLRLLNRSR
jgi:modulator of FtsH protease HflC